MMWYKKTEVKIEVAEIHNEQIWLTSKLKISEKAVFF